MTDNEDWTRFADGELIMFEDGQPSLRATIPIPEEVRQRNAANLACA